MIVGGRYRCDGKALGEYLGDYLKADKNDRVELIEIRGSGSRGLTASIASWEDEARGSKCKSPLWHAHLRGPKGENLTREQQVEAVDILERHLGFVGQPRAIVIHENDGHEHVHVVWSRIRRQDETIETKRRVGKRNKSKAVDDRPIKVKTLTVRAGTAKDVSFTKKKNVAAAREIEERFGLQRVESPAFEKSGDRRNDRERSSKAFDQDDYAKAKRSKLDPAERQKTITALWQQTDGGKALQAALLDAGYVLARGDSRNFVVVDKAGDIHSLARQIKIRDVLKEQVDARLSDIDSASIPRAKHIQLEMWRARKEREADLQTAQGHTKTPGDVGPQPHPTPARSRSERLAPKPQRMQGFEDDAPDLDSLDPAAILATLTRQRSTFTKTDLHREIAKRLQNVEGPDDLRRPDSIAEAVGEHTNYIALGEDRAGRHRFTSRDVLGTELAMRDSSDVLATRKTHHVKQAIRDAAPSAQRLGVEQRQAFEHITSADGLSIVIGYAGTGKSFALGAAREAWEGEGYRVRGVALAGIAAQSLQQGSGIESRTLQSLFGQLNRIAEQEAKLAEMNARISAFPSNTVAQRHARAVMKGNRDRFAARLNKIRLTDRNVIVLDEAGMVGSRQMNQLLAAAEESGAKVVLVGDAEQLQAIDAGGAFRALYDRHGAVKITEVRRQEAEWQKTATKQFGDGFADEALADYRAKGHIHQIGNGVDADARMVADWTASRHANPSDTHVMLAYTKVNVAALNQQAREAFKAEKRLGSDEQPVKTETGVKMFATGDRFFFLENRRLASADLRHPEDVPVMNGSLGTVQSVQKHERQDGHRMRVKLDTGKTVEFDTNEYTKFDLGYASTVHKSQGITAGRAFILASEYMDRHAAGVSMTRHVKQADMYYSEAEFSDFGQLLGKLTRDGRKDTTLDYLDRAEKTGEREKFLRRANKVVEILSKEGERAREFERLAAKIRLERDPASRAERDRHRATAAAVKQLQDVLGDYPDSKERHHTIERSLRR